MQTLHTFERFGRESICVIDNQEIGVKVELLAKRPGSDPSIRRDDHTASRPSTWSLRERQP
jgi:hypothetical protein